MTMTDPLYVGVDWSESGWFAVAFDGSGFDHAEVFNEVGGVWAAYEETADRILVDVPVGLREDGQAERPPETAARAVLGPRASAVVTPPVREAARKRRYPAAERVTERKTGASLSEAAFAASDAVVAVDELLAEVSEARAAFREAHPEVCFRAFAGTTLDHAATVAAGYAERMRALATFDRDAPPVVQSAAEATAGSSLQVHDVLNAVVLAYAAAPGPGELRTLPADPPTDATGLPMAYTYRAAAPLSPPA